MIIVRDREIIARNLINIIDVKNCQYFSQFMNDEKIEKDEQISNDEFNSFMQKFRVFKRKYLM